MLIVAVVVGCQRFQVAVALQKSRMDRWIGCERSMQLEEHVTERSSK
jgi:hypothetical protein